MRFQYVPYLWLLLASTAIMAGLAIYAWRRRAVTGAHPFAILMSLAAAWALANGLEMAGADLPTKLFWANVQYLCYVTVPVAWLALALQISGRGEWLTRRNLALLAIEPIITVALAWTDPAHGLVRRDIHLDTAGPFPVIGKTFGPWFWVHAAYTYLLLALTLYLLVTALRRAPPLYRRQRLTLLIGAVLPLVWNLLYNLGLSPIPRHDIAPAVLSLSGLIVAWGLFRFHLFDIMPVARAQVVEGMEHGVIVLDDQDRVVDLNPAARRLLGRERADPAIGRPAADALESWPALVALIASPAVTRTELTLPPAEAVPAPGRLSKPARADLYATAEPARAGLWAATKPARAGLPTEPAPGRVISAHISPLRGSRGRYLGRAIVLNDITARKEAEVHLAQQQQALAVLEEREWLARELHDSLGQVLGYVNVQAQATQALLARDQVDLACGLLERLADVARAAQADVREFIAGVRGSGDHEPGFKAAIAELLQGSLPACRKWARPRQTSEVCPPRVFGPNQLNHCTTDENFLMAFAWLALACPG
ncbi:MAG: hypothetical protein AUK03_07290 [Anaerolineae bacterium CG2_30_64_16]|nr:MAG: hypothetical protein AUK03_07290 [Anaerolineae bacterium CG2_30_64_16]